MRWLIPNVACPNKQTLLISLSPSWSTSSLIFSNIYKIFLSIMFDGSRQVLDNWQVVYLFSKENYSFGIGSMEQGRDIALLTSGMNRAPHINNIIY